MRNKQNIQQDLSESISTAILSKSRRGPNREKRWTRGSEELVLRVAAASCALMSADIMDAMIQSGTGVRRAGRLGCERERANRAGTRVKRGSLEARLTIRGCEWVGGWACKTKRGSEACGSIMWPGNARFHAPIPQCPPHNVEDIDGTMELIRYSLAVTVQVGWT